VTVHQRRLKVALIAVGGSNFECQIKNWSLDPGEQDGDRQYTFCPDGEFVEETDPEPTLELEFFADWRSNGISDYLWEHRGEEADVSITNHPDLPAETTLFSGTVRLKAPPVGGEARSTEMQTVTLLVTNLNYARGA
jgi:hypothetical protein